MTRLRTPLLRARALTYLTRQTSRIPHHRNGLTPTPAPVIATGRTLSFSQQRQTKDKCGTSVSKDSPNTEPFITKAKYAGNDHDADEGAEFEYFKIPPHLIPIGWTNDAVRLESFVKWGFEKYIPQLPKTCIPILHHNQWWGLLAMAQGKIFLYCVGSTRGLFQLKSPMELTQLLQHMKNQPHNWSLLDENALPYSNVLKHPELEWVRLA